MLRIAALQAVMSDGSGARSTASQIAVPELKTEALAAVAKAQVRTGALPEAVRTTGWIVQPEARSAVLTVMARKRISLGDRRRAKQDLLEAKWTAFQIPGVRIQTRQLALIAVAQAEASEIAEAIGTASEIADERSKATAIRAIAETQASLGDMEGAHETAAIIGEPEAQHQTLLNVATKSARRTPIESARTQLNKMVSVEEKIRFILALSEKYFPKRRHLAMLTARP
jgi:hypothetical protein